MMTYKTKIAAAAPALSVCGFLLMTLFFARPAPSQTAAGRMVGTVTDPAGAVIVGAKVTVTNTATQVRFETATRPDGSYQVLDLPIGNYTVSVQQEGFQTTITQAAELSINQTLRLDVRLALGAVSQTVAVEARAAQVETENPTVGGTVTGATVSNLPLNGRNTLDLALTQPGVTPNPNAGNTVAGTFSIAGGRPDSVSYLMDGADNNSVKSTGVSFNPNPDTVAEFRILTNNYTAEYGRSAGGVVSVVTKSGTNQLHGSLFEYLRNEDFNASDFFSNETGQAKPVLKRSQFGGTFGGPIVLPKIVNGKDKLFFFFGYQGQQQTQTAVGTQTATFTPAELQGNFSQAANGKPDKNVVAFLQSNPYYQSNPGLAAQGIIDPSKIDPVAQNYTKNNLITTSPTGFIVPEAKQYNNDNEVTGKVDIVPSTSDRIAVTVGWQSNPYLNALTLGFPIKNVNSGSLANIDYTKTIRPNLLNEARAAVNRYYQILDGPAASKPFPKALGVNINSDRPDGPVQISLTGALGLGFPSNEGFIADNTYTYSDTLTWIKGRHTFKGGVSFAAAQDNSLYNYQINGVYYFYGSGTSTGSGNSLADFLFGLPDEYAQEPSGTGTLRQKQLGLFFQDEWKVTPRLLLTLGLRYEYDSPQRDIFGRTLNILPFHQSTRFPSAPLGAVWAGDPGAPSGAYFPDKLDFAPRFGFAWDPFGRGRTSVRGGFGMFYDVLNGWNLDFDAATPPFYAGVDFTFDPASGPITSPPNVMSNPFTAAGIPNPFPSPPIVKGSKDPNYFANQGLLPFNGAGEYPIDPFLKTPYVYQYNLSLQQQLGQTLVAEISYVGSDGHRLVGFMNANPMIVGTKQRLLNVEGGYATSNSSNGFGTIPYDLSNVGTSSYNGLVTSLTKRLSDWHGAGNTFFTVSYTWSHAIDNVDGPLRSSSTVPYYNHQALRGSSDFDIRQRFVLSGGWELPFAHLFPSVSRKLTSGWSLYPIFQDQTGRPLIITAGLSRSSITAPGPAGDGDGELARPNLVAPMQFYDPHQLQTINGRTGNFYFNPSSLNVPSNWKTIVPTPGQVTYGSLIRGTVPGPGLVNLDLSLEKKITFSNDRMQVAFRAEFFNVLNHTQFSTIGTSFSNGLLGQATAVNPARVGQLALRMGF